MKILEVRSQKETDDAASLMRGLYEAVKSINSDDTERVEEYYRGSWFFDRLPQIPTEYRPPLGDILIAYQRDRPVGSVAICRMDRDYCELKSMFVTSECRGSGVAQALCKRAIELAKEQGYHTVRLMTSKRQVPARRLYERLGFKMIPSWETNPHDAHDYFELSIA